MSGRKENRGSIEPRFSYFVAGPGLARPLGLRTEGGLVFGPGNLGPPGYELRSYRRGLGDNFHAREGARASAVRPSPDVFDGKIDSDNMA